MDLLKCLVRSRVLIFSCSYINTYVWAGRRVYMYLFVVLFPILGQQDLKNSGTVMSPQDMFWIIKYCRRVSCWKLYWVLRRVFLQLCFTCKAKGDGRLKKTPSQICVAQGRSWINTFRQTICYCEQGNRVSVKHQSCSRGQAQGQVHFVWRNAWVRGRRLGAAVRKKKKGWNTFVPADKMGRYLVLKNVLLIHWVYCKYASV